MLIGPQEDAHKLGQLQSDVMDVTQAMLALPIRLPGTRFYRGLQARKRIMDALRQEICMRRENGLKLDRRDDFLQTLLLKSHMDSPEEALTDEQILDNILTLIIAGQVTTATAITWMVKYLGDNTDLQEKLRSIQLDLASKHHDAPLTLQHLNTMDYAYKTVKESLRMATIVSWFPRVALKDCQVAGRYEAIQLLGLWSRQQNMPGDESCQDYDANIPSSPHHKFQMGDGRPRYKPREMGNVSKAEEWLPNSAHADTQGQDALMTDAHLVNLSGYASNYEAM
uniref:Abscisic acid 8'-hydroxylase 3 n=2 Tax=Aegilops tauschii TaxID=37682 RepID=M8B985_AEGTA